MSMTCYPNMLTSRKILAWTKSQVQLRIPFSNVMGVILRPRYASPISSSSLTHKGPASPTSAFEFWVIILVSRHLICFFNQWCVDRGLSRLWQVNNTWHIQHAAYEKSRPDCKCRWTITYECLRSWRACISIYRHITYASKSSPRSTKVIEML